MKFTKIFLAVLACATLLGAPLQGQVSMTGIGTTYTQSFDGMGTATVVWADNSSIPGWYLYVGLKAAPFSATAGTGTSTAGGAYNFGGTADRALGGLGSGSANPVSWGVRLKNNTGVTITALDIAYTGEEWRNGGANNTQDLTVSYQVGTSVSDLVSGTWTTVSALTFFAPTFSSTATALDGNLAANRTALSTTIGVTMLPGDEIMIRWVDVNHPGNDHGLASDDFSVTPRTPTIVNFYSKASGNLDLLSTWGSNTDGSGPPPANFTTNFQIFNVRNNATPAIGAPWTVAGALSKIVVGDGVNACTFTVPSAFAASGVLDVAANAALVMQNPVRPTLGSLAATSTVNYAYAGPDTVVNTNYGNLILTGGSKAIGAGASTVQGNLLVSGVSNFNGVGSPFASVTLQGNFTLQSGTAFDTASGSRFTLICSGSSQQTFSGNGSDFQLFSLTVNNPAGVVLSNAGGSSNVGLGNNSGGGLDLIAGTLTVNSNTLTTFNGLTFISGTSGTMTLSPTSNLVFNQAAGASSGFGTLRITPGSETLNNLTVNLLGAGYRGVVKLSTSLTVAGTLTLTNGVISTGANVLSATGTVARTNGRVYGSMQKPVAAGATTKFYELGDTTSYAPVSVAFANVSTPGTLIASTTVGLHPSLVSSGIDTTKRLNRYFTLTNGATAFTSYAATFNFVAGDVFPGANTSNFVVKRFELGSWSSPTTASPLATSIQTTGNTAFGDFAVGQSSSASGQSTVPLLAGWNLVSVPRIVADPTASVLFPGAVTGTIYGYAAPNYVQVASMTTGEGYWALYNAAASNSISGANLAMASVVVPTGNTWVLIGSVTASVPASALTSAPAGAIAAGTLFTYDGTSYVQATTIDPGKGYWVLVNTPSTLTITGN